MILISDASCKLFHQFLDGLLMSSSSWLSLSHLLIGANVDFSYPNESCSFMDEVPGGHIIFVQISHPESLDFPPDTF